LYLVFKDKLILQGYGHNIKIMENSHRGKIYSGSELSIVPSGAIFLKELSLQLRKLLKKCIRMKKFHQIILVPVF
jgi:hypothetical protein